MQGGTYLALGYVDAWSVLVGFPQRWNERVHLEAALKLQFYGHGTHDQHTQLSHDANKLDDDQTEVLRYLFRDTSYYAESRLTRGLSSGIL